MKFLLSTFLYFPLLLVFAAPVSAGNIQGADQKGFQSALADWLKGSDKEALVQFAELARRENRAAQVFLGQIEKKTWLHDHVTSSLTREKRIELLRNPKGLSGKSWLVSAATDTPLAEQMLIARQEYKTPENGLALLDLGAVAEVLPVMTRALNAGDPIAVLEFALHENALPYSRGMIEYTIRMMPDMAAYDLFTLDDPRFDGIYSRWAGLPALDENETIMWRFVFGEPRVSELFAEPDNLAQLGAHLQEIPMLKPMVEVMERHCPTDTAKALGLLQALLFPYSLMENSLSPVPSFVSTSEYQASARYEQDILHKLAFADQEFDIIQKLSPCLYQSLSKG